MTSLLRQIVAGPRARHPEANLDLCYVTDNIIATSGPSDTYPQRAYRNPLDQLVKFLDDKHGENWAIWEFRAEGTGYPDEAVYNRVRHYPWPDHHPPPFALIPMIVASMRNWLHGEQPKGDASKRIVVVHCKAGKGRSGTASCSYLISEEGWTAEQALQRFTDRRMRPGFGNGVSIPSQLRTISYVDRWTHHGKLYVEREVEITEVRVWGIRDGVKVSVEGYVDEGRTIRTFHTFSSDERKVTKGRVRTNPGLMDAVADVVAKYTNGRVATPKPAGDPGGTSAEKGDETASETGSVDGPLDVNTGDVIFRPAKRITVPSNDINIDFERRNKASNVGLTMVTSVAHVWFNTFFEGKGPEQDGNADESGIFEIDWEAMDGIKGSSRKGIKAFDRISVTWRAANPGRAGSVIIREPTMDEEVRQTQPADWRGTNKASPDAGKELGIRMSSPDSRNISRANSSNNLHEEAGPGTTTPTSEDTENELAAVRTHGPQGEDVILSPDAEKSTTNSEDGQG